MSAVPFLLLRTKLHQPLPPPALVTRRRLLDKLLDREDAALTLIVASAGSGKTTLAIQWLERVPLPVAWLSLDETDNDPAVFLGYLIAAIQTVAPGACADTRRLLHALQPPPADFLAASLVNDLNRLTHAFILVLDDYHCIRDAAIHGLMDQMLRHAPSSFRLVIATRFDPPLALNRLASRGKLVEIRSADLRFQRAEAQALLERVSGYRLSEQSIDSLVADLDGWAVGLQSAALALRQSDGATSSAESRQGDLFAGDHRRLIGILGDEIFSMQPSAVRDFLTRTAVLGQLTAPLCQFLLSADHTDETATMASQSMLERLERDSLFIEALDEERQWYRYHNLFRAFLTHKLEQTCSDEEIATLHRRASLWYRRQGSADEAFRHALAAQDASLAADVVEANLYEILDREEWPILDRWLSLFPSEDIQQRPLLLVAQAWVLFFQLRLQAIPPLLAQTEALLEQEAASAPARAIRCDLEALHALMSLVAGDFCAAAESAQRALCHQEPGRAFSRGVAVFLRGMALYALRGEEEAVAFCTRIIDDPLEKAIVRARAFESLCHIFGIACRPIEQARAARALLKLAQEHRLEVSTAWAHRHLGSSYYERNDLEAAVRHFSLGVEQRYLAHFVCARDCFVGLALAYQAQGRMAEAEAMALALEALYMDRGMANLPEADSFQARLAFLQGDTGRALRALERLQPAMSMLAMDAYETATITQAMIHILAGTETQRGAAVSVLSDIRRLAEASHSTWYLIRILALQAIALSGDGQTEAALAILEQAIMLGRPGRVVGSIIELGQPIKRLLRRLAERGIEPAYVRDLLAAFPSHAASSDPTLPSPGTELVEPLTGREMQVLLLLNLRLSNKEIAANLVVSPLTVKRHMTNIMQKLGVDSRWDAVERARELGLLPFD